MPQIRLPSATITRARSIPIENIINERGIKLRGKIDRAGPCPRCGGDDRFAINTKKQVWLCRGCAPKGGDGIKLVQHLDDISFPEACEQLSGETFSSKANKAAKPQINPAHKPSAKATAPAQSRIAPTSFPPRTPPDEEGKPFFVVAGDEGPAGRDDESRRHVYRQGGVPIHIKIIKTNKKASNAYRVTDVDGTTGWQFEKQDDFKTISYFVGDDDPFETDQAGLYWPEGEKDVETLARLGLPAFTFGGTGDGLPQGCEQYVTDRNVVILADNDDGGRKHAEAKAALAVTVAASVRVIHFPELDNKQDVTDWIDAGHTAGELAERVEDAEYWQPAVADALAEEDDDTDGRAPKQADVLINLAQSAELFHTPSGDGYADIAINDHRETWLIRSKGLRRWLTRRFFEETGGAPNSDALQSALNVIEARAHFDAPVREVHIRVGGLDGRLYLDLTDDQWRAVEIDATGWRIIGEPPVRFRRTSGMKPISPPVEGGKIDALRAFLNVKDDADFVLVVAWALAALRNCGPYPVLALSGEQGSAKSTFSTVLRALVDPNTSPLRALPHSDRDLFIAANNGHVLAFDNVSGLPSWISDTLCRLATGGGFSVRQLFTDQDEVLFEATRPVILNGIEDVVTRPDLADRAVLLTLEPIPEEKRRPEAEFWVAFDAERPRILGALLDAVAAGLKHLPEIRLDKLPRMADFALWATACETSLWPAGTFRSAYGGNLDQAVEGVIDADPVASAVRALIAPRAEWTGTASELLSELSAMAGERLSQSKGWPDSPRALSGRLRRAATFLRKGGIDILFKREGRACTRFIHITSTKTSSANNGPAQPSAPSASSAQMPKPYLADDLASKPMQTVGGDADGRGKDNNPTVCAKPLKSKDADGAANADAKIPPLTGDEADGAPDWSEEL